MKRVARSVFRKLYWYPLLCSLVAMLLASVLSSATRPSALAAVAESLFKCLFYLFWIWLLLGRPIAFLLLPLVMSTLTCPGCGEEIEAVDVWDCACGFHDFRERHILQSGCPLCGAVAGHLDCPRCSCTILLW